MNFKIEDIETLEAKKKQKIQKLNDLFRQNFIGGQVVATRGIVALDKKIQVEICKKVKNFNNFTFDNDPHQEHDFGKVEVAGIKCFWKIDYYGKDLEHHSLDPSDSKITERVMTIMLAKDY
jgi:hypothetical protein